MRFLPLLILLLTLPADGAWLKGNLHTHTSESDGDSTPPDVAAWYASHGYDFLVITDHDKLIAVQHETMVIVAGEEVTDRLPKKPLHVNAIGLAHAVQPQGGASIVEVLQRNVDAVRAAGGIALINHPNFGWAFGAAELLQIDGATLLEIASGHPYVNSQGPPSVEEMWDALLTAGKRIYGVAVDDSHHLKRPWDTDIAPPGKAWVVVRSEERSATAIVEALARGDFYASTGVELEDYLITPESISVCVRARNLARYRVQFIGRGGRMLQETDGTRAKYSIRGDEGYVRARVLDSNGKRAWMQPVMIGDGS